jgi:hypothetical protein
MNISEKLIELLEAIDRKRTITEYTMTELQKIAEKAVVIIGKVDPEAKEIAELKEAVADSNDCHKKRVHKDGDNIMDVLRQTKFAIESFLYREYGIEI